MQAQTQKDVSDVVLELVLVFNGQLFARMGACVLPLGAVNEPKVPRHSRP